MALQQQTPVALAVTILLLVLWSSQWTGSEARGEQVVAGRRLLRMRRSQPDHHTMFHSHLSRKVFDRACTASKDTIDEIIACVTNSEMLTKTLKDQTAKDCYSEAFGADFDPKDVTKHKELICKNREKFETMTACIYKKTGELMDPKELEKFTESLVDVGLCIINALDG